MEGSRRRLALRTQLIVLVLATLLPLLAFATAAIISTARHQREAVQARAVDTARALLSAVDRELRGTVGALELLAASGSLQAGDLSAFRADLARVVDGRPAWLSVRLATRAGRPLAESARGAAISPGDIDAASFDRAVQTRKPAVGHVIVDPPPARFAVQVPVLRGTEAVAVLTALLTPAAVAAILEDQRIPSDWTGAILDARHAHVARTGAPERFLGQQVVPELGTALARGREGWIPLAGDLEGQNVYATFSASAWSGWSVALGIPAAAVDRPLRRSLLGLAAGGVAAALAAIAAAVFLGRRLAVPITGLAERASAIVRGEGVVLPPAAPAEVATLAETLTVAATERSRAEHELRRTDRLLQAVFEGTTDAVYVKDRDGRYVMINSGGAHLLGRRPEEVVGKTDAELFTPESAARIQVQDREVIEAGVAQTLENPLETVAGTRRTYLSTKIPYRDGDGRIAGVMGITRDITDRRRVEEERAQALERAEAARHEAERANRAKDEFLAVLSHELRTPLNAVYGWARMLRTAALAPDVAAHALEVIERNAVAQRQLIEDLLDVSRIVSGKMRLDVRALDLTAVVLAAVDAIRPAAEARGLRVTTALPSSAAMTGDPERLQQVVWNLVSNAVKFTPQGGEVHVEMVPLPGHVEIVVQDTGQGIAADVLPHVFDRFQQGDSTTTRAHGGLGLGLALVRHLVELHGGSVRAESAGPDRGARFSVSLPVAPSTPPMENTDGGGAWRGQRQRAVHSSSA